MCKEGQRDDLQFAGVEIGTKDRLFMIHQNAYISKLKNYHMICYTLSLISSHRITLIHKLTPWYCACCCSTYTRYWIKAWRRQERFYQENEQCCHTYFMKSGLHLTISKLGKRHCKNSDIFRFTLRLKLRKLFSGRIRYFLYWSKKLSYNLLKKVQVQACQLLSSRK